MRYEVDGPVVNLAKAWYNISNCYSKTEIPDRTSAMSFRHLVLALLARRPMSGYVLRILLRGLS
jgi:hypothetical protein